MLDGVLPQVPRAITSRDEDDTLKCRRGFGDVVVVADRQKIFCVTSRRQNVLNYVRTPVRLSSVWTGRYEGNRKMSKEKSL